MKYLINCDIFGMHYNFLRDGNIIFKTKYGLCFTIIYIIIVIALFFGFGIGLYTRKNPKVSFNSLIKPYEEKILSNDNFLFAYRIEDFDGIEFTDNSIMQIQLFLYRYIKSNGDWKILNSDNNYLPLTRCLDIPNIQQHEKYYNTSLKNWYCIDFGNITLGGDWDGDFTNHIYIEVKQCDNRTVINNTCKSEETILNSFKSTYVGKYFFSYLYMEANPTLDDFDYPLKSTLINRYVWLDTKLSKKHIQIYKEITIFDDRGWIFSDFGFKSIYSSDIIQNDYMIKDEIKETILFTYNMYFGKRYEIYNRNYIKVQEVIGSIGGFCKIFYVIVSTIFSYISNIMKNYHLMEEYNIDYIKNYSLQTSKLDMTNRKIIDYKINKLNKVIKHIKKKELDISYIIKHDLFYKKNTNLSNKNKLSIIEYKSIKKYNNHVFDVITYLKLFKDFNLIKKILLDDVQLKALDIIKNKYIIDEPVDIDLFLPQLEEYMKNYKSSLVNKRLFSFIE